MDPFERRKRTLVALGGLSYRAHDVRRFLREIVLTVAELLAVDWVALTFCQDGTERVLASSLDPAPDESLRAIHGTVTNTVFSTGRALRVEDAANATDHGELPPGYVAYLGVPLRTPHGEVLGTICSFQRTPHAFSDEDLHAAELFAERAAIALENYLLYEEERRAKEDLEAEVQRRAEQIRAAQEKVSTSARLAAIGELAAMIVHEVRNPLTAIMIGVDTLAREDRGDRRRQAAATVRAEANRVELLLREVLLYAKPHRVSATNLELGGYVEDLLPVLREMPEARERAIVFRRESSDLVVRADGQKLRQVFSNLVVNACEATRPGDLIRIAIGRSESCARVSVNNGGPPIDPETLARLVEPFFTTKGHGTGLGLPIVARILEAHGGRLEIASEPLAGTTVAFTLPLVS
jgi:signal transduction histidine kinase